tara:strand:- start:213 stop:737 length:525 start_codon:yes stop_codon:yes gene_type:complete
MRFVLFFVCFLSGAAEEKMPIAYSPTEVFAVGKPQQRAKWFINPNIRVCDSTEVTYSRISRAVRYWENAGYVFDNIITDSSPDCMNPLHGEIIITIPESGFANHHMASTRIYTSTKTGDIVKAKIQILPKNARKERVIEHEIGHALGWMHYRQKSHIMHPTWYLGGYGRYGLRK